MLGHSLRHNCMVMGREDASFNFNRAHSPFWSYPLQVTREAMPNRSSGSRDRERNLARPNERRRASECLGPNLEAPDAEAEGRSLIASIHIIPPPSTALATRESLSNSAIFVSSIWKSMRSPGIAVRVSWRARARAVRFLYFCRQSCRDSVSSFLQVGDQALNSCSAVARSHGGNYVCVMPMP